MNGWMDKIRAVKPYVPGEQPQIRDIIKLNTNELPYPPSPAAARALAEYSGQLRLYPSFVCRDLKDVLGGIYGAAEDEIFLGNGSDEVLALCFMTFFNSDKPVLFPDITYSFYDVWCSLYGIPYKTIPLDDNFCITNSDYYGGSGGIVIANPNAPTGICKGIEEIEDIVKHSPDSIVIIDEAYIDFGGQTAAGLIHKYDNVVIVQTFSKSRALAGIRLGFAMAQPRLIAALEAVKNSFNSYTVNTLTQVIGAAAARDTDYLRECTENIIAARDYTVRELDRLGFKTLPSKANFIFTSNPNISAKKLFEYLRAEKIIVRYFDKPRISEYLRITIGTRDQMGALISAVKKYIGG